LVDPSSVRPAVERSVTAESGDPVGLLIAFLNELLYLHESEDFLMSSATVTALSPTRVAATLAGETIDPARHQLQHHVKAATYHRASISQINGGWQATVIVDI